MRAANGLSFPYIGYLELDVTLCGKIVPDFCVPVVKHPPNAAAASPGILGSNIIRQCYYELFAMYGPALFNAVPVAQAPGPDLKALQRCHQVTTKGQEKIFGSARVRGRREIRIPGGIIQLVATTCTEHLAGQAVLFEPTESSLPAGLLASPCLVHVFRGTTYVPVVNVGTCPSLSTS